MQIQQCRAAILVQTSSRTGVSVQEQQQACRRYCEYRGYQTFEQDIYENDEKILSSDTPQLVQLRMLVVQGKLNVLVIPWSECLGILPLWKSLSVAMVIDEFYKRGVRLESVKKRHGIHDIYHQMLLDAL